ncbi:hypothetical protein RND81_02G231000 [Saponaria officinalis]|uniref:CLAVATA3/ESR (CLE)-related protein 25 n=1 Tax=Saponaria officinalis TaxID=3572 RepID=A0AAW1MWP5_SAPOF
MGGTIISRKSIFSIKKLIKAIALVSVIWFYLVGYIVASRGTTSIISHNNHNNNNKHQNQDEVIRVVGRSNKLVAHFKMDIINTSKRKVPNGPDPIHNRRASNSRWPPRQA